MANSSRRYIDKSGKMFIPMNMDGGNWDEHFITLPKLLWIVGIVVTAVIIAIYLNERASPVSAYIIYYAIWAFLSSLIIRFIVFQEKYYYKMYLQLKDKEITTPSILWDIVSIDETMSGAIMTYSDGKIGVLLRLNRDTITGKPEEFMEDHYDAMSDMYKEIVTKRYNFVQLDLMEEAGKDPRIDELNKLTYGSGNKNIDELMEMQIGHIKNITHNTLFESEYFLIYSKDMQRVDSIIEDCEEIAYKAMRGAYIGYQILGLQGIVDIVKELYGVKFFDNVEATMEMYKEHNVAIEKPFELKSIVYTDGDIQEVTKREKLNLDKLRKQYDKGELKYDKFKDIVWLDKDKMDKDIVDFDTISKGYSFDEDVEMNRNKKFNIKDKFGKGVKTDTEIKNTVDVSINLDEKQEDLENLAEKTPEELEKELFG